MVEMRTNVVMKCLIVDCFTTWFNIGNHIECGLKVILSNIFSSLPFTYIKMSLFDSILVTLGVFIVLFFPMSIILLNTNLISCMRP